MSSIDPQCGIGTVLTGETIVFIMEGPAGDAWGVSLGTSGFSVVLNGTFNPEGLSSVALSSPTPGTVQVNLHIPAANGAGNVVDSTSVTWSSGGPVPVYYTAPTLTSLTPGDGQATANWAAAASCDARVLVSSYTLRRGTGVPPNTDVQTGLSVLTYTDTGLTNGVTYQYKVRAIFKLGSTTMPTVGAFLDSNTLSVVPVAAVLAVSLDGITVPLTL